MRFGKPVRTNVSFNASLRKDKPNEKIVAIAYYEAPLPPACPKATNGVEPFSCGGCSGGGGGGGVGESGYWSMTESTDGDVRLLTVKFKDQAVHTFSADDF